MPRPGDWDAIGLGGDPTPGDPEKISALAEGFQKMGSKAREIITAIEAVMNKNDDSVFVGQTAEALRGKVDGRLRGHVESVASAFETSATALREWRGVVVEQQAKADAALNAGRGLAEDDPERENHKNAAKAAGDFQSEQASSYAGRINGVSDIKMPISDCEVFWEAFKWLAIILIIPALIFGGPIALIALGVNLALFIKTIVDVAKGDASFLDLFLAGLGLIAPTTKALPIFSIVKAIGKGIGAGVKGIAQTFKNVFSKDFLFNGLLAGLKSMPMLANLAIRETGLFVVKNLRNFPIVAGNFTGNFGKIALNGFNKLTVAVTNLPAALGRGFSAIGKGVGSFLVGTGQFLKTHFGGLQWTRIFLPVAADEIRAFKNLGLSDWGAFTQALKVGVVGRGVFAKDVFGLPMVSAIGKGVSAIPIDTAVGSGLPKGGFLGHLTNPQPMIPAIHVNGLGNASGAGFNAGHAVTAIDDININLGGVKNGDLGISVNTPTITTQNGLHIPANAGHTPTVPVGGVIPSAHVGAPQLSTNVIGTMPAPQVNTAVLPIHVATGATPPPVHVNTPHLGADGVVANIPSHHVGTPEFGSSLHLNGTNVQASALNNVGSLHVPAPANSAGLSDLAGSAIRNNAPAVSPHFGTSIGEGASHGFQANHFKVSIDEILNAPNGATFNGIHALNPPAVDRINAALDLVHNPGATTHSVTPPTIHTAKPAGTDVNVNVNLAGGADLKVPPPATIKVDNPGLAGAQNPPGNVGAPGHGINAHGAMPETQLVPLHPQPAPTPRNPSPSNAGINNPGINNPGAHNPGVHNPGYTLAKGPDIGHSGIGTNTIASRTEIPLPGLTDRPGAYVTVERTEGGVSSFSLYGGGPDGRMDVLAGGNLRFTDTATGQTTRFDSGGIVLDQGLRLTKADGVLRPIDHILIAKPGGEFRVTTLTGDVTPDLKISRLDNGGVQLIDEKGVTFHYNPQGKLENQPLSAAWDKDLAAKAGVFRQPGDTDAMVNAKMADFGQVQRAQSHFDNALENVAVHGHRGDGPSTGPAVGDQVHLDLRAAEADLTAAKSTFEGKHGLSADGIQQQLDNLMLDSLKDRPRLVGGVSRSFDLPGGDGMRFELNGTQVSFSGPKADAFSSSMNGKVLTITEAGAGGKAAHTWTYTLGFGGRANQIGESFPLNGGLFDGQPLSLEGRLGTFDKAMVTDLRGNQLPVKVIDDGFVVPSPQGPMAYDKTGGFHGIEPSVAGQLPKATPPAHLSGDNLLRWNAQADISRTHLTVAAENKTVDLLMKDVAGGSFTSKKGFEGYVNPQALKDGTLIAKVHTFETVAKDLAFKGPEDNITLYRGVSMDPASAKAGAFTERLPISTSTTMKFQDDWAKNGVLSNRVVFEIDVPPGHSKLAMSYPEGYKQVLGDAPEVNASQFEVTLAPTTLVKTGPTRTLDNGLTIIPVRAEQIPPSRYESVITAKWPGLSSETAFGDFVKSFELNNLKQFPDLENVTAKSVLSQDGRVNTVTVSKPGFEGHDLTITVMRDPKADSVRVTIASDGANKFDQTWSKTDFKHLATDLRGGVLHNNEQFMNLPQPARWADEAPPPVHIDVKGKGKQSVDQGWADDLAAKANVFRKPGDTDAIVNARMVDYGQVEHAQGNIRAALDDIAHHGGRLDGASTRPEIGEQVHLELRAAETDLANAKAAFEGKHGLQVDSIQQQLDNLMLDSLKDRPRLPGAGMRRPMPIPDGDAMFKIEDNSVNFLGDSADDFRGLLDGTALKVTKIDAEGNVFRTLNYELNDLGWPMLKTDQVVLRGGDVFDGRALTAELKTGSVERATVGDLPVRYSSGMGEYGVPSALGTQVYDRAGNFLRAEGGLTAKMADPLPPLHLEGDDLARWKAHADLSRTHLTAADRFDDIQKMMQKIYEGRFTSQKGFGGYVDPYVLQTGSKSLTADVHAFNEVAEGLLFDGPVAPTTVYRGMSMDSISAQADNFVERLPLSTSSNWDFQKTWAKDTDLSGRVVFQIDVPPGHGKLSMSYPEGYQQGVKDARAWNQGQYEVTLSPTVLERTGDSFVKDGMTVIPVRAQQIPAGQLDNLITERWPGMSSEGAFDDFGRALDQGNLQKFSNMSDVTATSKVSTDGMIREITVSKPGLPGHDLTIKVTRDPHADAVNVTVTADGKTSLNRTWSQTEFSSIATDLRAGTLHDNDLFVGMSKPAEWNKQSFSPQWDADLAAKANVFRRPGDTDAMVDVKMEDFSRFQQTETNLKHALDNVDVHGGRPDGPSVGGISVGDQVRMDLDAAQADLDTAKIGFKRKHSMDPDQLQDDLGSLPKRPKLPGAGRSFEVPGGGVSFQVEGTAVNFTGTRAGEFTGSVSGREITVTQLGATGDTVASWTFRQGFGRPNLTAQTIHLSEGPLAGEIANLRGIAGQLDGTLGDGGVWPMRAVGDELFVATPGGPLRYGRDGTFHGPAPTSTSHLPQPTLPANLHGNPVHWTNQVDLSRTHLTAAAESKAVENLMKDVMGGSFTSKRGFEGYVNPLALEDGTLIGKTQAFADVTRDLRLRGPDQDVTLYRGVSMDPVSARADEFVDRLPSSTSNNLKFQEEWAKNGVSSNRFVFEIEVPAGHGKLSMSYPPGYQAGMDEARAWNQSQWEVTLAPTTLVRTGPNRVENGMTIIPVRADQIAPSAYHDVITAKWPGLSSESAFNDFAKSFELDNLRKFTGLETVTSKSVRSTDGLTTTITVSKPGFADDLTITVLRDAEADSVRVTVAADGMTTFDQTWSKTDFKHLATDLRGNVLHNNDLFAGKIEPLSWRRAATQVSQTWSSDLAARANLFRQLGDSDALVLSRMEDFQAVQKTYDDFAAAAKYDDAVGGNQASTSSGLSIGDRAQFDLHVAQEKFVLAKQTFEAQHPQLSADGLLQGLDDLRIASVNERPRGVGAGGAWSRPEANTTGYHVVEGNRTIHYDSSGTLTEVHFSLNGTTDRFVVRDADGLHVLGDGADDFAVRGLDDGGFRIYDADGHAQRYAGDGTHLGDGISVVNGNGFRGDRFVELDGAGGGRLVDLQGNPVPNATVDLLPNNGFRVTDGTAGDVRWFGNGGHLEGTGVRLANDDFVGAVFSYRAEGGGGLSLVDDLGHRLPHRIEVVQGDGVRVTDPGNGIARTFDDTGAAIDRRIPLHQPEVQVDQRLIVVHDVRGTVSLVTRADVPGPGRVELIAGGGGYRAFDNGNYHVYNADGAHQTHGVAVTLPGEQGFLEIGATSAQRVDASHQPIPGRTANLAGGEITVTRAGGHDVFDLQGVVVREVSELDPLGAGQVGGRVTRDQNGAVTWTDAQGAPMPTPHRVTIDAQGNVRIEIHLTGSPRNGEYHQYSRSGQLTEQGFPVLNHGQATQYKYVVDRATSTWTRTGGNAADVAGGGFLHGKVEVTGVGNGQLKLVSSTAKEVQVFERRWLPDDTILDSFRKTDTLGFGSYDRRTTWASYDNTGGISNWGKREFDTSGFSWRDVDHNGRAVHHYQQGLQKYANPIADEIGPMGKAEKEITGHVLATRGADGNWTWHRFDADGALIGSGQRTWEKLGDGFTDRVTLQVNGNNTTEIAQQKWGTWNSAENANQYKEFKLENGGGALERPGNWEIQGKAGKPVGSGTKLPNDSILDAHRVGEQRPPVWFRDYIQRNPTPTGNVSHVANDSRYQIYRWETTGGTNPGQGVRYVAGDESFVDVGLDGRFVRFEGKLHDGTKLKVGDQIEPLATAHPSPNPQMAWEAGDVKGWRVFDNTNNSWQDFADDTAGGWTKVRESHPGGEVREFRTAGNEHVWVQRDAHGNLVGSSHQIPPYGHNPPTRYIEATGPADGSRWTWRELDVDGTATGVGGERFHFKGSRDQSISWDNSFRDFDARGNLVRDRHMLDEGRYVESWKSGNNNWHSAEFDKLGQRADAAMTFDRRWGTGDGRWSNQWNAKSTHFKDSTPNGAQVPHQVRFETPQHIGDGRPVRVREYHVDATGNSNEALWKEFDIDKIVRERAASGANYLETDKLHGQWKLWDGNGRVIGERSDNGLVFELRGNRLVLTGNEFDFRGAMTEFRGWNARIGDAQRQPWLMHSDWTLDPKTLQPGGSPLRMEANYVSYGRLLTQKMLLTAGTEFVLDYAAGVIILAIIAEANNKPFTGDDALKALMNAAVGTVLKTVAGTALTETRLGSSLRELKTTMGNLDGGKLATNRPNNNSSSWGVEWAGNTSAAKWRGGTFDYGFGMMMLPLTAFVNGTMNAAIFGVKGPDGKTIKLTGGQAVVEGLMGVATGYAVANSIGMLRTIGMGLSVGRYFQKGGLADIGLGFGLKFWEKGMASLLAPALRQSMNPAWSRPNPQPLILPPGVTVPQNQPQPQVTSSGVVLPPGVQVPPASAPQTGAP